MIGTMNRSVADALRWALESSTDPAMAAADWLARDIDPSCDGALDLISNPVTPLEHLVKAKAAFKTMRVVGETRADRRVGARMYLAAIAAALVRHQTRISRQSDEALRRALRSLNDERSAPEVLRSLAGMALCVINERQA